MNKNAYRVIVTDTYLRLAEIKEMTDKYKSVGFATVVLTQLALTHCKGGIGRISNLRDLSHRIGVQLGTLIEIMKDSSAFVMDEEHDIFYMPRLRCKMHLTVHPSSEEIEDICRNGNISYY